jgi:hypothetical protein
LPPMEASESSDESGFFSEALIGWVGAERRGWCDNLVEYSGVLLEVLLEGTS